MAQFKVGQRVRITSAFNHPENIGREGTILGPLTEGYGGPRHGSYLGHPIEIDGFGRCNRFGQQMIAPPEDLRPLTDPAADAFLESVKSWKPEPVAPPLPAKERVTEAEMYAAIDEMLRRNIP